MVTCAGYTPPGAASAEVRWLRARLAELEAQNEVIAAQQPARDARLDTAQAKLALRSRK